jgi:hypothetical protein
MLKMFAGDPGFDEVNRLWSLYAIAVNPQVWANRVDISEDEMNALRATLVEYMEDVLDTPPAFIGYMNRQNVEDIFDV